MAINVFRGDSKPLKLTLTDSATGDPVDIGGWSFTLTVHQLENPTTEPEEFQVSGVITDAVNGEVEFRWTTSNTDLVGSYWCDVEATDDQTYVSTILKEPIVFKQDITK